MPQVSSKRIPVKPQDYDKIVHMDASATHWSLEHSKHSAAALTALSTFQDLVAAKNQAISEVVKASGVDLSRIAQARLVKDASGDAFVEVLLRENDPAEPAAPEPAAPEPAAPEPAAPEPAAPSAS